MKRIIHTVILSLCICAGSFIGQYMGSASLRSQINGWAIHKNSDSGWYFVYHEGLPEAMFNNKIAADNYINVHK
jgi:hypothetical protein